MESIMIYVTCSNSDEAKRIARHLVGARLVACANIVPRIESIYRWEGVVEEGEESLLLLKTRSGLFEEVREEVRKIHSYKTPAVISYRADQIDADYFSWLKESTSR